MMKIETRANFKGRFHNLNDFYATATSYLRGVKFSFISMPVPVCQAEHIEHGVNCNKITVRVQFPLLNWVVLFLAIFSYNGFFFLRKTSLFSIVTIHSSLNAYVLHGSSTRPTC